MRAWLTRQRGTLVLVALVLAGGILGQAVAERSGRADDDTVLTTADARPRGALALALWLERLGYRVARADQGPIGMDEADVVFVLAPIRPFARDEATALLNWVRRGGTLVYMPGRLRASAIVEGQTGDGIGPQLDVRLRFSSYTDEARGRQAVLSTPATSRLAVGTRLALDLQHESWLPLVEDHAERLVFAATRPLDQGRVYAVSSERLFTNEGIGAGDNAGFVLNVLARAPTARTIVFEEAHHRLLETPDLLSVMRGTPWGWAVAYALLLTFAFMVWGGRRFGPPVVPANAPPRSTGEYIGAFAGLLQRTRATDWLQNRYAALVRRRLGAAMGVRADMPSRDLARIVAERWPIDRDALAQRLSELDGPPLGERRLLDVVREVEDMLRAERK